MRDGFSIADSLEVSDAAALPEPEDKSAQKQKTANFGGASNDNSSPFIKWPHLVIPRQSNTVRIPGTFSS
jgi:hypothetical protein